MHWNTVGHSGSPLRGHTRGDGCTVRKGIVQGARGRSTRLLASRKITLGRFGEQLTDVHTQGIRLMREKVWDNEQI